MMEFFRNIGRSGDEKRSEALSAYLDGALSPREQQQLEIDLQSDAALRAELEQMRIVKQELRALPRRRVPRSFSLDPALYGPPQSHPAQQLYPILRGATALTALLFIFVLGLGLLNIDFGRGDAAQTITMAEPAAEMPQPLVTAPVAELELQPAPQAAEAGIASEEPASEESVESSAAEATIVEGLALEAANEAAAPESDARPSADITGRKEINGTPEALATGVLAEPEQYDLPDEAQESAATTDAFALPPESEIAPDAESSIDSLALWLGLATLLLGILTLFLRARARL